MSSFIQDSRLGLTFGNAPSSMNMKQSNLEYSFPHLKISDIIFCLKELGINITKEELSAPDKNKEQIKRIYEYLTEICTGISREELQQPVFSGLSQLNNPELHEESVPLINSFRAIQKLMETCGIKDFSLRDLILPTPKRVIKHLSGIINFAKYKEQNMSELAELNATKDNLLNQHKKAKAKNDELTLKLQQSRDQFAEAEKEIVMLEAACKEEEAQIMELNHLQAQYREDLADQKAENARLKEIISSKTLQLEELVQLQKKLQGQIVSSPDRFRKQISDVAESLMQEQNNIRVAERKLKELMAWSSHVEECQNSVLHCQNKLNEVIVEENKYKAKLEEVELEKRKVVNQREALRALDQNVQQLQRQLTRAEEKQVHLRKQSSDRDSETHQNYEQLQNLYISTEERRKAVKQAGEILDAEVSRVQKEMENEQSTHKRDVSEMMSRYKELEKIAVMQMTNLREALTASQQQTNLNDCCV